MVQESGDDDPRSHQQSYRRRLSQRAALMISRCMCRRTISLRLPSGRHWYKHSVWKAISSTSNLDRGEPRKLRQPMWLYYWHRFNSHLIAGKSPESFFATFSSSPEASR